MITRGPDHFTSSGDFANALRGIFLAIRDISLKERCNRAVAAYVCGNRIRFVGGDVTFIVSYRYGRALRLGRCPFDGLQIDVEPQSGDVKFEGLSTPGRWGFVDNHDAVSSNHR